MLLVFMIFMKELTNQILLPGFRAVLTVHSARNRSLKTDIIVFRSDKTVNSFMNIMNTNNIC